ncbi:probable LRR receptor-like serine/threonine-protein kinase RKF3 [Actinidia eriantha]|uniref:probable LRR receptor-like serine/threonine-protein kinase RKF3 n=1 Tax=Actinidia eriantha TaxID=165200 RepID=UPI00258C6608|nr:probable LRR receptor-like serine/threonine-protein kinase RKF3 [Actinidia eriantha]
MMKQGSYSLEFLDLQSECHYLLEGFRLVRSQYLQTTGNFSVPPSAAEACWSSFQVLVNGRIGPFDVRANCLVQTSWISNSCMNITTRSEFESFIPEPKLQKVNQFCQQPLGDDSSCESCRASVLSVQEAYFNTGNLSDCAGYPYIYAAAFANRFGPTDLETAKCLFSLDFNPAKPGTKEPKSFLHWIIIGCAFGFFKAVSVVWFISRCLKNRRKQENVAKVEISPALGLGLLGESTTLVKFTLEEMKAATGNFSRENLIGKGGYGNIYRGILADGSEVALKRFKNFSVSGDESFVHEVEVIASVKQVNLVTLRGYCCARDSLGLHQRIIVCDLMHNGSLHDHLFGSEATKLSWPVRRKIALGIARGLAYLHNGPQPAIIHRDVKSSNILLDESFEPKLADFGLAKFTPDDFSHMSTRVAGTLGYVAPEYALYGLLTERSDVYGFGVVLLELLTGKQAVVSVENGQPLLLTDWVWSLVQNGQSLDVIEEGMPGMGLPEVMEKYVILGVVCAHPLHQARPTMEQIVKILETRDLAPVPSSLDHHPISLLADVEGSNFSSTDQHSSKEDEETSLAHAV